MVTPVIMAVASHLCVVGSFPLSPKFVPGHLNVKCLNEFCLPFNWLAPNQAGSRLGNRRLIGPPAAALVWFTVMVSEIEMEGCSQVVRAVLALTVLVP